MIWDLVEVDHIRPVKSFDFEDENQIFECFHYSNLQPLWYWENSAKGAMNPEDWYAYAETNQWRIYHQQKLYEHGILN